MIPDILIGLAIIFFVAGGFFFFAKSTRQKSSGGANRNPGSGSSGSGPDIEI